MAYIGSAPSSVVSRQSSRVYRYEATAGQTVFQGADLDNQVLNVTPSDVEIHMNGLLLDPTDYTVTSTSVTLSTPATAGDELTVTGMQTFEVADTYSKTTADARYVNVAGDTMTGGLSVTGGNLGVGTSSPQHLLHIKSTGPASIKIEADSDNSNEADNANIEFSQDGNLVKAVIGFQDGDNDFKIRTGNEIGSTGGVRIYTGWDNDNPASTGNEAMYIDPNGYVMLPKQPSAFLYTPAVISPTNGTKVAFDYTSSWSRGISVNATKDRLTALAEGIYLVTFAVAGSVTTVNAGDGLRIEICRNGSPYGGATGQIVETSGSVSGMEWAFTNTMTVYCYPNDYIEFKYADINSAVITQLIGHAHMHLLG